MELAFIDGLHLFEQVLHDFVNLERYSTAETVIILHDCLPLNQVTAARERTTDFYCGDVWKATLALRRRRPDLDMVIVPTAPTGLCLVRGLDSDNRRFPEELPQIETEYLDLDFDHYLAHREELPPAIENDRAAVSDWLTEGSALVVARAAVAWRRECARPRRTPRDANSRARPRVFAKRACWFAPRSESRSKPNRSTTAATSSASSGTSSQSKSSPSCRSGSRRRSS